MIKFNKFIVLVVLLTVIIASVGCGQSTPNDDQEDGAQENDENLDKSQEKIIRMSVSGTPKVDPATGTATSDLIAKVNFYDTLVYPEVDGTIRPHLAEEWEYDEENLAYTFHLREGVKFHNGTELTASDVVYSMERLLAIGEGSAYLFDGLIKDVVDEDDYTVSFKLEEPFGPFISVLTNLAIVSEDEIRKNIDSSGPYGENGDYGRNWMLNNDAGSGPYIVQEVKQQEYVIGVRYKDYWGGWDNEDAPDTIRLIDNTEAATVRTLLGNKELEITDEWQSTENISAMSKIPGVKVAKYSTGLSQTMMYNNKKAPTDDANFRKALNYLYDYKTISENILVDSPIAIGPVSAETLGAASSNDLEEYTYDLEKAEEYLKKSKYGDQLDKYEVELLVNTDVADHEKIGLAFQAAAKKIGITVKISKAPWISIQEQVAQVDTTPNVVCISVAPHYMEAGSMLKTRYHSSSVGTWEQAEWLQNNEIDLMIEDSLRTVELEERLEKYKEIQEKIVNEITPSGWLVDLVQRACYREDYVYWPVGDAGAKGEIVTLPNGYSFDFRDFKVYPNKR